MRDQTAGMRAQNSLRPWGAWPQPWRANWARPIPPTGAALSEQSVVRDRFGSRMERVGREAEGDLILRDRHGFRTERMQGDGRGGYIIRDRHGFRTGRISPPC